MRKPVGGGGEVLSCPGCRPIPGAQKAGDTGGYAFTTSPPGICPGRPPRIHFTTQLYLRGGEKAVRFDSVVEAE